MNKPTKSKSIEDILETLRAISEFTSFKEYFAKLEEQELMVYLLSLTLKTFTKHEALCRIGEAPTNVFYLFQGQIGVTNLNN